MTWAVRAVRHLTEAFLRYVPSRHGNDGLTANERRLHALRYQATVGYLPPHTPERIDRLDALAEKCAPRVWHRSSSRTHSSPA